MENGPVYHELELSYEQFQADGENISHSSIGRYFIYEKIGEGGFGQVYKGMNDDTKLPVAIKLLDLNAIHNEPRQRLREIKLRLSENEDKMMLICNNANLVKCFDVYLNKDLKLIIMEYCDGGTLEDYLQEKGRIPE
jgi:serine/threonine protein kinase